MASLTRMSGPHSAQEGEAGDPALPGNLLIQNTQNILETKSPSKVKSSRFQSKKFRYYFKSSWGQRNGSFLQHLKKKTELDTTGLLEAKPLLLFKSLEHLSEAPKKSIFI